MDPSELAKHLAPEDGKQSSAMRRNRSKTFALEMEESNNFAEGGSCNEPIVYEPSFSPTKIPVTDLRK